MFTLIVVAVLVLIIAMIVYLEYKNEKEYQESRRKKNEDRKNIKPPYPPKEKIQKPLNKKNEKKYVVEPRKVASAQEIREAEEKEKRKAKRVQEQKVEKVKFESTLEPEIEPEIIEKIDLPECKYPKFTYSRLLEMGLGEDEAMEFVKELIPQLKTQIPLIKEAMDKEDFHSMERLTHSIKGSSTTVGTGGVSDLLVEFNTYLKSGKELSIAKEYFKNLNRYRDELEKQFA